MSEVVPSSRVWPSGCELMTKRVAIWVLAPRLVLDYEGLAQCFAEFLGDQAGGDVGAAAGPEGTTTIVTGRSG